MEAFGKFMATLILLIISAIISGFVLSKLWMLFISSTFSLPVLSIPQAIGITIIIEYLRYRKPRESEKFNFKETTSEILSSIIRAIIILGIGYIVALFL